MSTSNNVVNIESENRHNVENTVMENFRINAIATTELYIWQ